MGEGLATEKAWRDWHRARAKSCGRAAVAVRRWSEFHDWLQEAASGRLLPKSPVGKGDSGMHVAPLGRSDALLSRTERCRSTTNLSERIGAARGDRAARITCFSASDNGGKAAAILYSVMASAKANQVEPFAYVRDLLVQCSGEPPEDLSHLLPDVWLKAHPEARRRWSR